MKIMIKPFQYLTLIGLLFILNACSKNSQKANIKPAETPNKSWVLLPEYSSISIITTKNNSVSEVSNFTAFSGNIKPDGQLSISIDLNSLETHIPIRNERIQKHLFKTEIYQTADIHTQLKPNDFTVGIHNISFDVDLHGLSALLEAEFMVFEQYGNKVVTLHRPLIITAGTFGLENGITTLKNIARLDSINLTVPVNITLTFEAQ